MLGGSSGKSPGQAAVRMASPNTNKVQNLLPMNKGVVFVPGPAPVPAVKNDPRMVLVQGPTSNLSRVLGRDAVLVPVTASPDGKMIATGGPVLSSHLPRAGKTTTSVVKGSTTNGTNQRLLVPLHAGSMLRQARPQQQNKPMVVMSANQASMPRQPILVQVPKSQKNPRGQMMMVPVTSTGFTQGVSLATSTSPSVQLVGAKGSPVMLNSARGKGMNFLPVSLAGNEKSPAPGPVVIRLPAPQSNATGPIAGQPLVVIPGQRTRPMKQVVTLPSMGANSLPKGVKLIPVSSSSQLSSFQFNSTNIGALQGGKLVFVPNPGANTSSKSVIFDPKLLDSTMSTVPLKGRMGKPNYQSLIHKVGPPKPGQKILYRQIGTTINKPIQPKPPIETTDTFFKTPIEIKPLEEEHDDDLENVLSALTGGGGNVNLMPVNTGLPSSDNQTSLNLGSVPTQISEVPNQINDLEEMGLKIDSVYSLSSNSVSWDEDNKLENSKKSTDDKEGKDKGNANSGKEREKVSGKESNEKNRTETSIERERNEWKEGTDIDNRIDTCITETSCYQQDLEGTDVSSPPTTGNNKERENTVETSCKEDQTPEADINESSGNQEHQEVCDREENGDDDRLSVDSDETEIMDENLYRNENSPEKIADDLDTEEKADDETSARDDDSDGTLEEIRVPDLSIEPLSPEDEPSQSGPPKTLEQSHYSQKMQEEETGKGAEDPKDIEPMGLDEEDPNLMRGDCLQVRLAQQAARQLQEQMRRENETFETVSAEWRMEEDEAANNLRSKSPDTSTAADNRLADDDKSETDAPSTEDKEPGSSTREAPSSADDQDLNNSCKQTTHEKGGASPETSKKTDDEGKKTSKLPGMKGTVEEQSEAHKALVAAALNGCEVADSTELNDMFDELISEYFNTPERPKPSVRVRGIEECRADQDDGPQSLVTTTQTTPTLHTISSLSTTPPKSLQSNRQFSINTSSGPITLVQVKVPVPGKPGATQIKYIPMQLAKPGQNKATMPQYVKILPSASAGSSITSSTLTSSGKGVANAHTLTLPAGALSAGNLVTQGKSLLKFVVAPTSSSGKTQLQANLATKASLPTPTSNNSSNIKGSNVPATPLTNEELASAVSNAARNVLGMGLAGGVKHTGLKPSAKPSMTPGRNLIQGPAISTAKPDSNMRLLSSDNRRIIVIPPGMKLVQGPGGVQQLVMTNQASPGASGLVGSRTGLVLNVPNAPVGGEPCILPSRKKKKKKKKKIKLPKTKPCAVLLRRLNMKVIKKSVNLKRVKNSFLFEAISRQPMRGAKRKAEELISNEPKKMKTEGKDAAVKLDTSTNIIPTSSVNVSTTCSPPVNATSTSAPVNTVNAPNRFAITKDSTLYQIMSQLPAIKPAPVSSHLPSLTPTIVTHTSPMKPHVRPVSLLQSPGRSVSLLHKNVSSIPGALVSSPSSMPCSANMSSSVSRLQTVPTPASKAITLTLSCTTASSNSTPVVMTKALTSVAGPVMVMPSNSLSTASTIQPSRPLPPLHPAAKILVPNMPNKSAAGVPMPTLQPAPRSILVGDAQVRGPIQPPTPRPRVPSMATPRVVLPSHIAPRVPPKGLPLLRPRPPIVIQPNADGLPRHSVPSTTANTTSTNQGGAQNNKRFLLIKTPNGQFLVPVPEQGQPISLAGARPIRSPSTLGAAIRLPTPSSVKTSVNHTPPVVSQSLHQISSAPPSHPNVHKTATENCPPPANSDSGRRKRHAESPVIVIKDEPIDTEYDKHEYPPPPKVKPSEWCPVTVKKEKEPEKEVEEPEDAGKEDNKCDDDDDEDNQPRVPASLNHIKRIEELKARLRKHEEELATLRKDREDTNRELKSLQK